MKRKTVKYIIIAFIIPLTIALGAVVFEDRRYAFVSAAVAILSCVPFFLTFERGRGATEKIVVIALMIALSVAGRFIFAPIPFFKPVTAIVVITAIYFGAEAGFVTGAMSAVISNLYFGQGPWTPFQMFSWGLIGFVSGLLANPLQRNRLLLVLHGIISGIAYSFIMDIWTTLWADGFFNLSRFIASVISAAPVTAVYGISNVIFLLILNPLLGKKIRRIKIKYGI